LPRWRGRTSDHKLWRKDFCGSSFFFLDPCQQQFGGSLAHGARRLSNDGERWIGKLGPSSIIKSHQRDLIWNPYLLFSESRERSRSHFVIRHKECGWTLFQRQNFFRGTPSRRLSKIAELDVLFGQLHSRFTKRAEARDGICGNILRFA
jgi:hypothetical protein